ncbi:MAG: pyridoxal 5'-phosphate synthase glutaminase subunit PdxT [Myxococcota bacterium]|nr:pyridoxal 5'-phosphate synthase glutaminase subunit PdxT [Myxococcota bacterium]
MTTSKPVGVLALQGGYAAHESSLRRLGLDVILVRYAADLDTIRGLVFPGGESTTHLKIISREGLRGPLDRFARSGAPILTTCAGTILAARTVSDPEQDSFGWLDIDVSRNAWGRQVHSFEAFADGTDIPLTFIRAPRITRVGPDVSTLLTYEGEPIMVQQGAITAATFHPELGSDIRIHQQLFGGGIDA